MRYLVCTTLTALSLIACGGGKSEPASQAAPSSGDELSTSSGGTPTTAPSDEPAASDAPSGQPNEFVVHKSEQGQPSESGQEPPPSSIKGTKTEAALKFTVVDKETGPIEGIVISVTAPDGTKYYTGETSPQGYAEVLVPIGQKYEIVYLSLGRKDVAATLPVPNEPNQNLRLTLRYKRHNPPPKPAGTPETFGFILDNVVFDSGKATIREASLPQLDSVAEYLTYKKSARIEISGHTDNVGNPKVNKALSQKRAQACKDYLVSKGVEGDRITAVGYGDERPIAPNESEEGRQKNRRIEATEL